MTKLSKTKLNSLVEIFTEDIKELQYISANGEAVVVQVNQNISFEDYSSAVNELADMQFAMIENDQQIYAAYLSAFSEGYIALKYFTNIPVDVKSSERANAKDKDIERLWKIIRSDCMQDIYSAIGCVWNLLRANAVEAVRFRLDTNFAKRENFMEPINLLFEKYGDYFKSLLQSEFEQSIES